MGSVLESIKYRTVKISLNVKAALLICRRFMSRIGRRFVKLKLGMVFKRFAFAVFQPGWQTVNDIFNVNRQIFFGAPVFMMRGKFNAFGQQSRIFRNVKQGRNLTFAEDSNVESLWIMSLSLSFKFSKTAAADESICIMPSISIVPKSKNAFMLCAVKASFSPTSPARY